jgi:hypothetical protein
MGAVEWSASNSIQFPWGQSLKLTTGAQSQSGQSGKHWNPCPYRESNPSHSVCSQYSTIPIEEGINEGLQEYNSSLLILVTNKNRQSTVSQSRSMLLTNIFKRAIGLRSHALYWCKSGWQAIKSFMLLDNECRIQWTAKSRVGFLAASITVWTCIRFESCQDILIKVFPIFLSIFRPGIPNLFWMATHLTKLPRFRDTPLTVRPPPPPSPRWEKKKHNYIKKTNKANLTG